MSNSRLKIEAESLDLELSGDADYVIDAYMAMRSVILERFEQSIRGSETSPANAPSNPPDASSGDGVDDTTNPLFRIDELRRKVETGSPLLATQMQLVVCTDLYYRVAALSRSDFRESILGDIIDPESVNKVYVDEDAATTMRDRIEFGKTLWRKLTDQGQAIVHGDSS